MSVKQQSKHELVAAQTRRVLTIRDGQLVSDERPHEEADHGSA